MRGREARGCLLGGLAGRLRRLSRLLLLLLHGCLLHARLAHVLLDWGTDGALGTLQTNAYTYTHTHTHTHSWFLAAPNDAYSRPC